MNQQSNWKDYVGYTVAVLLVLFFAVFVIFMWQQIAEDEVNWTRAVYLLTGVEAVAFAAVGYLFGRDVHRKEAESAREDANDAKEQAKDAQKQASDAERRATKAEKAAKDMKTVVIAASEGQSQKAEPYGALGPEQAVTAAQADLSVLAQAVEGIYSDL